MATETRYPQQAGHRSNSAGETEYRIANSLGWFSIGLGLAEVLAPRRFANFIGVGANGRTRSLIRIYGMRELAAGIGILSQDDAAPWLWARVGGDLLDLSSLGKAIASDSTERGRVGMATAAVAGITALDVYCAQRLSGATDGRSASSGGATNASSSIIIDKSQEEIYAFWRNLSNLPRISKHLESVQVTGPSSSHWRTRSPVGGKLIEWDAEITEDRPNAYIEWRSFSTAVPHSGSVSFARATGGRGTKVTVRMDFGGSFGTKLGKLVGAIPREQANIMLHNLKQLLETGEIVRSDASIHPGMHPGQPPKDDELRSLSFTAAAG